MVLEHPWALWRLYVIFVRYTYYVQGDRYSGFDWSLFRDEREAEAAAAGLSGSVVNVRYKPLDPDLSALAA